MEIKQLDCHIALTHIEEGSFAGYASVFNIIDSQKDIILPGAFTRTLQKNTYGKDIKLLWQHHRDEPIGYFTLMREDAYGLYVEGTLLLDVQRGKEAYALLKSGAMEGLSIGYSAIDYGYDEKRHARLLKEVDLWEISLVTFPANSAAVVTTLKSEKPHTIREFEGFLREHGFSRKEAKSISLYGFKYTDDETYPLLAHAIERGISVLISC